MSEIDPTYFNQFYIYPSYPSDLESEFEVDYDIEQDSDNKYARRREVEKLERLQQKKDRDDAFLQNFDVPEKLGLYVTYLSPKRIHLLFDLTDMVADIDPAYVYALKLKYDRKWGKWTIATHRMPGTARAYDIFVNGHISDEFLSQAILVLYNNVWTIAERLMMMITDESD